MSETPDTIWSDDPAVWLVLAPRGCVMATFASQELADQWIWDNPTVCSGASVEGWCVHTAPEQARP